MPLCADGERQRGGDGGAPHAALAGDDHELLVEEAHARQAFGDGVERRAATSSSDRWPRSSKTRSSPAGAIDDDSGGTMIASARDQIEV